MFLQLLFNVLLSCKIGELPGVLDLTVLKLMAEHETVRHFDICTKYQTGRTYFFLTLSPLLQVLLFLQIIKSDTELTALFKTYK